MVHKAKPSTIEDMPFDSSSVVSTNELDEDQRASQFVQHHSDDQPQPESQKPQESKLLNLSPFGKHKRFTVADAVSRLIEANAAGLLASDFQSRPKGHNTIADKQQSHLDNGYGDIDEDECVEEEDSDTSSSVYESECTTSETSSDVSRHNLENKRREIVPLDMTELVESTPVIITKAKKVVQTKWVPVVPVRRSQVNYSGDDS